MDISADLIELGRTVSQVVISVIALADSALAYGCCLCGGEIDTGYTANAGSAGECAK